MAEVYATLIINEEREFKNLSARMKAKVNPILISLGFEELTQEESGRFPRWRVRTGRGI